MSLALAFKNLKKFDLKPDDEVYFIDESISDFIIIKRTGKSLGALYYAKTGECILKENEFDSVDYAFSRSKDDLIVSKDGKIGVVSSDGKLVVPIEFREITGKAGNSFIVRDVNGKYGVCSDGKILAQTMYTQFKSVFGTHFLLSKSSKRSCVVNRINGKVVLQSENTLYVYSKFIVCCNGDIIEIHTEDNKVREVYGHYCRRIGNDYLEVTRAGERGVVYYEDGSVVVPFDNYIKFKKIDNNILAQKSDGSFEMFTID